MPGMNLEGKNEILTKIKTWLICATIFFIIFNFLVLGSISIIMLTSVWFFEGSLKSKWELLRKDYLFIAYAIYFLIELLGIFLAPDIITGWKNVETKLGFIVLPIIFCSSNFVDETVRRNILLSLSITMTIALLYCLIINTGQYFQTHDPNLFFYHTLLDPLDQHAVYYSVFIFISLLFLLLPDHIHPWLKKHVWVRIIWISFFFIFIYLLASKLVLVVLVCFLALMLGKLFFKRFRKWQAILLAVIAVLLVSSVFIFDNPVRKRFSDILKMNREQLINEKYTQGDYFNGMEFRVLLWGITYHLLKEKDAFVFGVGAANTQSLLSEKYQRMGMYVGNKQKGDPGYLDYNCHNQLLQISLQAGIVGLAVFLFWCIALGKRVLERKDSMLTAILCLIFVFFLTESVFEREIGMLLCTVFPLLFLYPRRAMSR
ncbi:MAG: O-antigen ligase family protein [Chitinophagales bacterium]